MTTNLALFMLCIGVAGAYTSLQMVFADIGGWKGLDTGADDEVYVRAIRARLMLGRYGSAAACGAMKAAFFTALLLAGCGITAMLVKMGLSVLPQFGPLFAALAGAVFVFIGTVSFAGFARAKNLEADMLQINELELICERAGYMKRKRRRPLKMEKAGTASESWFRL